MTNRYIREHRWLIYQRLYPHLGGVLVTFKRCSHICLTAVK